MADVFNKPKRSLVMAAIRSKGNKDTELKLLAILRKSGLKGWRRNASLPGKPDFVFHSAKLAVFVDGCFWHGCPRHGRKPGSNQEYWLPKLLRNKQRDQAVTRLLRVKGWRVIRIWEHSLKYEAALTRRLRSAIATKKVQA